MKRVQPCLTLTVLLIFYSNYLIKIRKIKIKDLVLLLLIIYFSCVSKTITHIHLIGLIVLDKIIEKENKIVNVIYKSSILIISIFFVVFYSIIYAGDGRYLFTGINEINQSGLALILLFLIIRQKKKIIGNWLLIIGILTFSRNYFIGLILFYLIEFLVNKIEITNKIIFNKIKSFKFISIASIMLLILISGYFSHLYESDLLNDYKQGLQRYTTLTDESNYFRFKANTNLIEIYINNPSKLFVGLSDDEFVVFNREIASKRGQIYRGIRPHNYFFSYFRIYGVLSIVIFWYTSTIFQKVITKKNIPVFGVVFTYLTFLGIGAASYWLFLSIFAMMAYNMNREDKTVLNKEI
jgi:hypothetical protein